MYTFTLIAQCLRTGEPLHQVLDVKLLDRAFYHSKMNQLRADAPGSDDGEGGTAIVAPHLDAEQLRSLDFAYYATALVGVFQLINVSYACDRVLRCRR
jgi:hypothetical protein